MTEPQKASSLWLAQENQRLHMQIDALRARVAELEAAARWIPVEERLPEDEQEIIAWQTQEPHCIRTIFYAHNWEHFITNQIKTTVTHWRPLPPPPEEK